MITCLHACVRVRVWSSSIFSTYFQFAVMVRMLASFAVVATAKTPAPGTYEHKKITATDDGLEEMSGISSRDYQIAYPSNGDEGEKLLVIVFAHGAAGGGVDTLAYEKHLGYLAARRELCGWHARHALQ